jgi:hypothetical protein
MGPPPPSAAEPAIEPGRFPNPAINLVYAIGAGVALGFTTPSLWWLIAIGAALALSFWHRLADSVQYRQFGTLDAFPNRDIAFLMLKSAVTFIEIVLVFLAIRAIAAP